MSRVIFLLLHFTHLATQQLGQTICSHTFVVSGKDKVL